MFSTLHPIHRHSWLPTSIGAAGLVMVAGYGVSSSFGFDGLNKQERAKDTQQAGGVDQITLR